MHFKPSIPVTRPTIALSSLTTTKDSAADVTDIGFTDVVAAVPADASPACGSAAKKLAVKASIDVEMSASAAAAAKAVGKAVTTKNAGQVTTPVSEKA